MAIQRSNIANNSTLASNGGSSNNRARDLSPISPRSSNASSSSGAQLFNPRLILSQIISLQSFHYLVLGIIFQINHVLFATSITIDRIFTTKYIDVWSAEGWIDNSAILLSSLIGWVFASLTSTWYSLREIYSVHHMYHAMLTIICSPIIHHSTVRYY